MGIFSAGSVVKNLSVNVGDTVSVPASGRSPRLGKDTNFRILAKKILGQRRLVSNSK